MDDRPLGVCTPLPVAVLHSLRGIVETVSGCAAGPAAARNAGWRGAEEQWTVFLDEKVLPGPTWPAELAAELAAAGPRTAAVQARLTDREGTAVGPGAAGDGRRPGLPADGPGGGRQVRRTLRPRLLPAGTACRSRSC
ncbi:hypothetical protein [Streptomyces orinoci]|uniref:Uncharacterized protein n=1 Tax=Streptomyces orinoci TaxID=67339 RepID=A0ABV3K6U7_STRON|nr:hypothetical protein [Streptomyces orinoci]